MDVNQKKREIANYMDQDLDTLFCTLSLHHSSQKEGLKYMPGQELDEGKKLFEGLSDKLHKKICQEWEYCKKRNNPDLNDTLNLGTALFDIILTLPIGFPPALISAILIKKGLKEFCGCESHT